MTNHKCKAAIVTCIDYRLQPYIDKWISEHFQPTTFDRIALAGGVKDIDTILSQIGISVRLHNIRRAVLVNHEDCGAYGEENIPDQQAETLIHGQDLNTASQRIGDQFPNLKVETYFIHLDGTFEEI